MVIIEKLLTVYESESFEMYLQEIGKYPLLTVEEEFNLFDEYIKSGKKDKKIFNKIVNSNLRFVISVAKLFVNRRAKLEDLVNEGNIGLMMAVNKFDHTRGFKFVSFAVWWIRQGMTLYLNENTTYFRLPSGKVKAGKVVKDTIFTLLQELMREPTNDEIIGYIGNKYPTDKYPPHIIKIVIDSYKTDVKSMDEALNEDMVIGDTIKGNDKETSYLVEDDEFTARIKKVLLILDKREKNIIIHLNGLLGNEKLTMDQLGEQMGLSDGRIQQLNASAMKKLKATAKGGIFNNI